MKKYYSQKQRKIHKLKRKNVILGQLRKQFIKYFDTEAHHCEDGNPLISLKYITVNDVNYLNEISFKMGKNSAKIQRLRTLISQEKSNSEN